MKMFDGPRVAVVTGGARGIGRATVETLLAEGAAVTFTYRSDEQAAKEVVIALSHLGPLKAVHLDINEEASVRHVFSRIRKEQGPVDVLVNNAGMHDDGLLASMGSAKFDRVIETNLRGTFLCCREGMRQMAGKRTGSIVNVSSALAVRGGRGQANYCASKAGILGMTQALALEGAAYGVRVNAVSPGFVETEMLRGLPLTEIAAGIPLQRLATPAEIADAIGFVCSDRAGYLTGSNLIVDGGIVVR